LSDIFLSYSSTDRARAKPLAEELERAGWTVWWDPVILPGTRWARVIQAALDDARCVIVLWSRDSVHSEWVETEAGEGKQRGILVPALLDEVAIPLEFRRIQAANLVGWQGDTAHAEFGKLVRDVSAMLGTSTPATTVSSVKRVDGSAAFRALLAKRKARQIDLKTAVAEAEALDLASQARLRLPSDPDYWVTIGPGTFTIGGDSPPKKKVTLKAFRIGRYPVTVWEYGRYLEQSRVEHPPSWEKQSGHPGWPAFDVTWHDAQRYCIWAKCTLPSEEQWEAAAGGVDGRKFPWGFEEPDEYRANVNRIVGAPTPVGIFPDGDTPEGVADMAGNVWEWTQSDFGTGMKALRGCSWNDKAGSARVSCRGGHGPDGRLDFLGFRSVAHT
jgi:formylglycine-generating enzyme required for sulfatase activity